jgi:L-amino acid N-acyltransferase YncA
MQQNIKIRIEQFEPQHWQEVSEIYRLGLLSRNATFETEVPDFASWNKKFHDHLRWVVVLENKIVGWAGLLPVSVRKVYEGVTEVSIYVHPDFVGKGIGKQLMNHLIVESEKAGIWTLYASIFPENKASIHLHVSNGFREIGYRERIAQLDGKWRDTVLFERRSKVKGI